MKHKWEEKQLYEYFKRQTGEISHKKIWTWLRKGNLKSENKSLLIAVQNDAKRTNYVKAKIDWTQHFSKCSLCGNGDEMIYHMSECSKLAKKENKSRQNVGRGDWLSSRNYARNWNLTILPNGACTTQNLSWRMRRINVSGILRCKQIT